MSDKTYHCTPEQAVELFRLDSETGQVFFKPRDREWFLSDSSHRVWNKRFANQETFAFYDSAKREYTGAIFGHTVRRAVVVWCLTHGEWPKKRIKFKDGDKKNTKPENMY